MVPVTRSREPREQSRVKNMSPFSEFNSVEHGRYNQYMLTKILAVFTTVADKNQDIQRSRFPLVQFSSHQCSEHLTGFFQSKGRFTEKKIGLAQQC